MNINYQTLSPTSTTRTTSSYLTSTISIDANVELLFITIFFKYHRHVKIFPPPPPKTPIPHISPSVLG